MCYRESGKDSLVIHDFDCPVNVTGYDPNQPVAKALRTVSAALAYYDPVNSKAMVKMKKKTDVTKSSAALFSGLARL